MKQSKVTDRFTATKEELERISNDNVQFMYSTKTKYIPKIGYVCELDFKNILKAKKFLDKIGINPHIKEMESLGLTSEEVESELDDKFLGVKVPVWETDLKTRIDELRHESRIANLSNDLEILQRNLDEKSIRNIDLAQLSFETV